MKTFFLLILIFCCGFIFTQTSDSITVEKRVYEFAEQMPEFQGGEKALYSFLADNIKYPALAMDSCISGTVYLKFIVNENGSVTDVVLLKGIGYGCDIEAMHVVNLMPDWIPGSQNGKNINVYYSLPVKFIVDCTEKKKE